MEFKDFIYHQDLSNLRLGKGSMLIADPFLNESYFSRSAVLILDNAEDEGHFGLVMNRESVLTMADIAPGWEKGKDIPIFAGGPVGHNRFFMLHTLGALIRGSSEILPGLYVGGEVEDLVSYIEEGGEIDGKVRFFLGYSGWEPGQLQKEVENEIWEVKEHPDHEFILAGTEEEYWRREVRSLGKRYESWLDVPEDPSMN